ncbi:MAG: cytochrome c [Chitinophagaceae bacterium]
MKYTFTFILFTIIAIFSCTTNEKSSALLSTDNLPVEKFTINTERDTVLQTNNGALLKITSGTLQSAAGETVTLEIKEAYSMEQIIRAGLLTRSNGQLLSSGGMIYINAAAGQQVNFKKKIQVAIPTDYLQKGMSLYKGEEKTDGKINWTNPDTLPENKQITSVDRGKVLFERHCTSCHAIGHDATGPDLAHLRKRFSLLDEGESEWDYYLHFIEYRAEMNSSDSSHKRVSYHEIYDSSPDTVKKSFYFDKTYAYKCNVRAMFGSLGTMFPDLTHENREDIYNYIQNESDRLNLRYPAHAYLKDCIDSCEEYSSKVSQLKYLKTLSIKKRQKLITENGEMTVVKSDSINRTSDTSGFNRKVSAEHFEATYYQFTVDSFGWFNIDTLLDKVDGVAESKLLVRIIGEFRERINIFIIIPSVKVYGEGGRSETDNDKYAFFRPDGTIPLPQNTKAFILAITEQNQKIAFGLKEFTTGLQQEFAVELKESTKEKFEMALKDFDADRLHIKVDKTKNADSIIAKDKELKDIDRQIKDAENLKPKGCDCDCDKPRDITTKK